MRFASAFSLVVCTVGVSTVSAAVSNTWDSLYKKNCSELGWRIKDGVHGNNTKVCAESMVLGVCNNDSDTDYSTTHYSCVAAGGRLCSQIELETNFAAATGCGVDKELIWTSTSCGVNKHMVALGKASTETPSFCASDAAAEYNVRCCGDTAIMPPITELNLKVIPAIVTRATDHIEVQISGATGSHTNLDISIDIIGYQRVRQGVKAVKVALGSKSFVVSQYGTIMKVLNFPIEPNQLHDLDRYEVFGVMTNKNDNSKILNSLIQGSITDPTTSSTTKQIEVTTSQPESTQSVDSDIADNNVLCVNSPHIWQDADNMRCSDYKVSEWCTATGYGKEWASSWGTFEDFATVDRTTNISYSASDVCCACGGGEIILQELFTTSSTTAEPDFDIDTGFQSTQAGNDDTILFVAMGCVIFLLCVVSAVVLYWKRKKDTKKVIGSWEIKKVVKGNDYIDENGFVSDHLGLQLDMSSKALQATQSDRRHRKSRDVHGNFCPAGATQLVQPQKPPLSPSVLFSEHPIYTQQEGVNNSVDGGYLSTIRPRIPAAKIDSPDDVSIQEEEEAVNDSTKEETVVPE